MKKLNLFFSLVASVMIVAITGVVIGAWMLVVDIKNYVR
jgi:hypothetical protein